MSSNHSFNKEITTETKIGLGILTGAALAAGLAAVYLASPAGREYRTAASDWAADIKQEVRRKLKKLQRVDRQVYARIIDDVVSRYQEFDEIDAESLLALSKELKRHYTTLKRELESKPSAKPKDTSTTGRRRSPSRSKTSPKAKAKSASQKKTDAKKK